MSKCERTEGGKGVEEMRSNESSKVGGAHGAVALISRTPSVCLPLPHPPNYFPDGADPPTPNRSPVAKDEEKRVPSFS